jgi:hypothetical protein
VHAYLVAIGMGSGRRRQQPVTTAVLDRMAWALRRAAPTPPDDLRTSTWLARGGAVGVVAISDEPEQRVVTIGRDKLATWTGYFAGKPGASEASALRLLEAHDLDAAVDRRGGVFSAAIVDRRGAQFHSTMTRVDPVYWSSDRHYVYAGTKALAVHLTAHAGAMPDYELGALVGFICAGYFPDDSVPFRGVQLLPPAHVLDVRSTGVVCRARSRPHPSDETDVDAVGADLARLLVDSCDALAGRGRVRCSLTGGKDSRLIAAALHASGIDIITQTRGHPEHADVVVARRISEMLGVEHVNVSPLAEARDASVMHVDPLRRARAVVRATEGMLSAYENVTIDPDRAFSPAPRLGGHGGELLRGGFATYVKDLSPDGAVDYMRKVFLRYGRMVRRDAFRTYRKRLQPWLDRVHDHPLPGLDEFYLRARAGRWSAAARSAMTTKHALYQPYFDDRVVATAHRAPTERRLDERLVHAALRHLAPQLVDVPFAGHRWKFDEARPTDSAQLAAWEARAPLHTPSETAAFNWRLDYGPDVHAIFAEQVLGDGPGAKLFEVLNRKEVEHLLVQYPTRGQHLCWRIFTASVLLSGTWLEPGVTPTRTVRINVPADRVNAAS